MAEKEYSHEPRWEIIEKLHDKIDEDITNAFTADKLSIIEVDIALLMIHEKINQQKMELYNLFFAHKDEQPKQEEKDAPDNLYK